MQAENQQTHTHTHISKHYLENHNIITWYALFPLNALSDSANILSGYAFFFLRGWRGSGCRISYQFSHTHTHTNENTQMITVSQKTLYYIDSLNFSAPVHRSESGAGPRSCHQVRSPTHTHTNSERAIREQPRTQHVETGWVGVFFVRVYWCGFG